MPICFVSICAGLQGPNCVFTPWEGQGAQAIEAGLLAIHRGIARCVLVGGCDVKTHELAFINLEQQGFFCSWQQEHNGIIPSEGAVFLLLEKAEDAAARGIRPYARLSGFCCRTHPNDSPLSDTYIEVLRGCSPSAPDVIISAAERDKTSRQAEAQALAFLKIEPHTVICPKQQAGNLFAAAAAMQVAMGAVTFNQAPGARRILANCFGHGSEQAAFVLEKS
jgi:3-oxoacyl-[acyl-carrier-protein] synthase II